MTTVALGRILVAIGNAILEEHSPRKSAEPVDSGSRLKRPRGLEQFTLNVKKVRRESPPSESQAAEAASQTEATVSQAAKAESPKAAVDSQAAEAELQMALVDPYAAEADESQPEAAVGSQTAEAQAAEAPRAKAKRVKTIKLRVTGDELIAIDWNELLEPCPIVEATTAAKVLQAARQKYGVAAARMHFSRDKQTSMPGPDGKPHRVFKHGLPRGLAWKLK